MRSPIALFFQFVVVLIGLAMAAFLLGEPHLEGRNAHATVFEIYFQDPFLAYVYVGSLPFFLALRCAFGLLGEVRRTGACSLATVEALQSIRRCALVLMGFVVGAAVVLLVFSDGEDRPAGVAMSVLALSLAGGMAITAAWAARRLQASLSQSGAAAGWPC